MKMNAGVFFGEIKPNGIENSLLDPHHLKIHRPCCKKTTPERKKP